MTRVKHILLVEDNGRDAELTLEALGGHRLANEVVHVRDGAAALDYLHRRGEFANRTSESPVLVLLDLHMPKVSGIEVLREVKSDPTLKRIPVLVMSSSREDRDLHDCYELGVNAYVVKPVKFSEFADAVRQIGAFWAVLNELPECVSTAAPGADAQRWRR